MKKVAMFTVTYYLLIVIAQQTLLWNFCQPATHCPNQKKIKSICEAEVLVFAEKSLLFTEQSTED